MRPLPALFLGLLASCTALVPVHVGNIRIVRDRYGVPHIYADQEAALFFGAGYAQAQDQLENLAKNYLRAAGRLAEIEGESELDRDRLTRAFGLREKAARGFANLDPEIREHFTAFAEGVNAYIREQRRHIPSWIKEVAAEDAVALALYTNLMFTLPHCERDLRAAKVTHVRLAGRPSDQDAQLGSNQFSVSPERSATGAAMLSMDPHLPLTGWLRWYEIHLSGPSLDIMGVTFLGLPYVAMGHNKTVAWSLTVNNPDLGDVFALKLNPGNPLQYLGPRGLEDIEARFEDMKFSVGSGSSKRRTKFLNSRFGPIIAQGEAIAYAYALPELTNLRPLRQLYDMAKAKNIRELREAISIQGLALFNILGIDSSGDSYYISSGRVPIRDTRIPANSLRPAEHGWAAWRGYHPSSELPQTPGDHTGFMLNTNSGPQSVNLDPRLAAKRYPAYMTGHRLNGRSRRLHSLLSEDSMISWQEMQDYATDTRVSLATGIITTLTALVAREADEFTGDKDLLRECATVLRNWDRRTDIESRGAVLFFKLTEHPRLGSLLSNGRSGSNEVFEVLVDAAQQTIDRFGRTDVAWGEYSRIRRGDVEMPCAGHGGGAASALRPTRGVILDGKRFATAGSSYGMIVDFSGKGRAVSCLPFGESDDPDSPHFADQLPLYSRGEFKPAWFHIEEVEANKRSEYFLDYR